MKVIDIAIFAHNEQHNMENILLTIDRQDIFGKRNLSIRVFVLANGCTDKTIEISKTTKNHLKNSSYIEIHEFESSGKSRTWNLFTHGVSRRNSNALIFLDADIEIPDPTTLRRLVELLENGQELFAATSRPVKDIVQYPVNLSYTDRLIAMAGGTLNDWKTSICGQLYALKTDVARRFHLPIGLPVEDGFICAMVVTHVWTSRPMYHRITGDIDIYHIYKSERSFVNLVNHQTRIVIGSSINSVLFDVLCRVDPDLIPQMLKNASRDPDWLADVLKSELPKLKSGWVPWHFLTKRIARFRDQKSIKMRIIIIFAFFFDLIIFIIAQFKMSRGVGSGHW